MSNLEKVLEEVESMDTGELKDLLEKASVIYLQRTSNEIGRQKWDALNSQEGQPGPTPNEDDFMIHLARLGIITMVPTPLKEREQSSDGGIDTVLAFQAGGLPMKIEGSPLSEMILEDRR